ncbi:MAG: hypothetical protein WC849_02005 [Candidatus Paceibacterota bacterium]
MKISDFKKCILNSFLSGERKFGSSSNLKRDWKAVVFIFLAINIFILVYSYYFFFRTISDDIFAVKQNEEITVDFFNRNKLTRGLNIFENKVGCSPEIKEINFKISDPSE